MVPAVPAVRNAVKRARDESNNMAYSTQVRETETKHTHTLERLLKDERHRLTCLRSQAKLLEIDRDDLREDLESLKETYDTAKTQLMFKDGQIEQLEVRDDISVLTHIPAPALPLQHRSSSTLEVDLTIALQVAIDECKIDWQRLNTRFMQRESDVLTAEKAKELERLRAESEATRSVCEKLGLECGLKASEDCQTYATLQLPCCGSFICEPCVQAWNKSLGGDGQDPIPGIPKLLRCFS
ncbi:g1179 [Coccomyxa elongata]